MEPSKPLEEWTTDELAKEFCDVRIMAMKLSLKGSSLNKDQWDWQDMLVKELRKRGVF